MLGVQEVWFHYIMAIKLFTSSRIVLIFIVVISRIFSSPFDQNPLVQRWGTLGFSQFVSLFTTYLIYSCVWRVSKDVRSAGLGAWCSGCFSWLWCHWSLLGPCGFKRLFLLRPCQSPGGIWGHYSSRDGLELGDSLAWGKAEVLLRHFLLSILQLRKPTSKFYFRCWKVWCFLLFFFFFFD